MKKFLFLKSLFFALLLSINLNGADLKMISSQDLNELKDNYYVIDIRTPKVVMNTGKIVDSILINLQSKGYEYDMDLFVEELKKNVSNFSTPIVLIDKTDKKSTFLAKYLLSNTKYNNITILEGGMKEWQMLKLPLVEVLVY